MLAELPLPVAGLLSDRPLAEVLDASRELAAAVRSLGVTFPQPVQMLAFLSLSVIPSLKITDRGLVDVERFELVPLADLKPLLGRLSSRPMYERFDEADIAGTTGCSCVAGAR